MSSNFYEGVDRLNLFTPPQLERYRKMLLEKTLEQGVFITDKLPIQPPDSVVELCCGNGRLLIELADTGVISRGLGIDLAQSRIDFATKWAEDLNLSSTVTFIAGDITKLHPDFQAQNYRTYDVSVCITGAFQYFPRDKAYDVMELLNHLAPVTVLELYNVPIERMTMLAVAGGHLQTWEALPPDDPYAYYMSNYVWNGEQRVMTHDKVFIRRNGKIDDGRTERLYYYEPEEIRCLMTNAGYKQVDIYSDWTGTEYTGHPDKMVIVGRV